MNKSQVIEAFNAHFMEFVKDIEVVVPNDNDIISSRKTLNKTLILMPKMLIRMFQESFVRFYRTQIESGDLAFFIDNDYKKTHVYKDSDDPWILEKIDCLRGPVRNMSDNDKENVIKYLQNLTKLSDLYISLRKMNN